MEWRAPKQDGLGFLSLWVFFPHETKHIENYFRISSEDYRLISSPENRNVYAAVRNVYDVVLVSKLELVL